MKAYVFVDPPGFASDAGLEHRARGPTRRRPMKSTAWGGFCLCLLVTACADATEDADAAATAPPALEGAWQVTEITRARPDGAVASSPRTGLRLFVDGQYTWLYINADE